MPLPGGQVTIISTPPSLTIPTDTGVAFIAGKATNANAFGKINSIDQFVTLAGARAPASPMYDSVERFFREGGAEAYISTCALTGVDTDVVAALAKFTRDLGPGQVFAPGLTTLTIQQALMAQWGSAGRVPLIDLPDTATAATLVTAAAALTGQPGDAYSAAFAPWDVVPGLTTGTTRTVPPSARIAGNLARNDAAGFSPNTPAAGELGQAINVVDLSQPAWSDSDRQLLNEAGVNVSIRKYGGIRTYGWRTLASQTTNPELTWFNNARLLMDISNRLDIVAERFEFKEEDGNQALTRRFGGVISGELVPYWIEGSLYGRTKDEAFVVDTGPAINTDANLAAGLLQANVGLRMSKAAERVWINVARVPPTQNLA